MECIRRALTQYCKDTNQTALRPSKHATALVTSSVAASALATAISAAAITSSLATPVAATVAASASAAALATALSASLPPSALAMASHSSFASSERSFVFTDIYVQVDNASDNKSRFVFGGLAWMVLKDLAHQVEVVMLPVGQ